MSDRMPPRIIVRDPGLGRYVICSLAFVTNGVPIYHMNVAQVFEHPHDAIITVAGMPEADQPVIIKTS